MLKVYRFSRLVSIDDGEWRKTGESGYVMRNDDPTEEIWCENISFDECYERLESDCPPYLGRDHTIFGHKPQIRIDYCRDGFKWYTRFKTISYKKVYDEATYLTLEDIMKRFPADKCIEYLKDRGLTVCPLFNAK